eukprot:6247398-Amphidinium_carterae.1
MAKKGQSRKPTHSICAVNQLTLALHADACPKVRRSLAEQCVGAKADGVAARSAGQLLDAARGQSSLRSGSNTPS